MISVYMVNIPFYQNNNEILCTKGAKILSVNLADNKYVIEVNLLIDTTLPFDTLRKIYAVMQGSIIGESLEFVGCVRKFHESVSVGTPGWTEKLFIFQEKE